MSSADAVRLRPARPDDREFFVVVRRAAFRPYVDELWGWDDAQQRADAEREFDKLPIEIIEQRGTPVGYVCVLHRGDHDYLDEIALLPAFQRRGIGSGLVRDVMESAGGRGIPVRLSVLVNNPARRLYERLGFREVRIDRRRVAMTWRPDWR